VVHFRAHLDEFVVIWLLFVFAAKMFPAIVKAKIVYLKQKLTRMYEDTVYVGIGGDTPQSERKGLVIDEHTKEGRDEKTCAALICADIIGLRSHPRYNQRIGKLLGEVYLCDNRPQPSLTMLSSLVKVFHRVKKGEGQDGTFRWVMDALDAIAFGQEDATFDLTAEWNAYRNEKYAKDDEIITRAQTHVLDDISRFKSGEPKVTCLSFVCRHMKQEVRESWLEKAFDMLVADSALYEAAHNLRYSTFEVTTDLLNRYPGVVIESDNEHASHIATSGFFGKAKIAIVRNSLTGHTLVSVDPKIEDLALHRFAALLRMEEHYKRTKKRLSFKEALGMGTLQARPEWHMAFASSVLNGSLSHIYVDPSKLSLQEIIDIATYAFMEEGVRIWVDRYWGVHTPHKIEEGRTWAIEESIAIKKYRDEVQEERRLYPEASANPSPKRMQMLSDIMDGNLPEEIRQRIRDHEVWANNLLEAEIPDTVGQLKVVLVDTSAPEGEVQKTA
jgi:hypothetical protein